MSFKHFTLHCFLRGKGNTGFEAHTLQAAIKSEGMSTINLTS